MRILAFDIGIKNLAWCCLDRPVPSIEVGDAAGPATLVGWANENLLNETTAEETVQAGKCWTCSNKAKFWTSATNRGACVRHCPPLTPALRDASGAPLSKLPALAVLKQFATAAGAAKTDLKSKVTVLAFLQTKYSLPLPPAQKVKGVDMTTLHEGIRSMVLKHQSMFASCSTILLENQPAFKNPVMKSVQMMLFATLRDILQPAPPQLKLVHAGKKTKGATGGDEGYSERKGASEARVLTSIRTKAVLLPAEKAGGWFEQQKKRSDLADCLCMCLDAA